MLLGDKIKKLREERGITQKQLGDILGVSDRTVGYYESNERFPKNENILTKIADYFDVTTDYLLGRTDHPRTVRLEGDRLPKELRDFGISWMNVFKEARDREITPEEIKKIIDVLSSHREKKK